METNKLKEIYENTLKKAELYHYVCYGGSSSKMVDTYTHENKFICKYQGDENWMTPICENCKGLTGKNLSLTESQRQFNYGVDELYQNIIKGLNDESPMATK